MVYERLKFARNLRGLTQKELAEKAKLNATLIAHLENRSRLPALRSLIKLTKALEVSADFLIGNVSTHVLSSGADPVYIELQSLTDSDKSLALDFIKLLINRRKKDENSQATPAADGL